jgi:hypothetical protein
MPKLYKRKNLVARKRLSKDKVRRGFPLKLNSSERRELAKAARRHGKPLATLSREWLLQRARRENKREVEEAVA